MLPTPHGHISTLLCKCSFVDLGSASLGSLNSNVWSENLKHHINLRPIYTEKFKIANTVFELILFSNILLSQNDSQNGEKSRHAKNKFDIEVDVFNFKRRVYEVESKYSDS